ncbi:hypothetical protein HN51_041366, partial [Arachis hypogaea]
DSFSGQIPLEIGALVSLQELYIEFNQRNEIGILDSLCDINLSNNKLEGLIPSPKLNCINFG